MFRICDWWKDRDTESDQYKIITDPDPVGPKTYGSGTLVFEELDFLAWVFFHTWNCSPFLVPIILLPQHIFINILYQTKCNQSRSKIRMLKAWCNINANPNRIQRLLRPLQTYMSLYILMILRKYSQCFICRKFIVVANTHLYFKPDADHIRRVRIRCL